MNDREQEAFDKGKAIGESLAHDLNCFNNTKIIDGFIEGCTHQHRSLQQCIMKALFQVMQKWADDHDNGWFDDRNKQTCEFSHKAMKLAEDHNLYFPLI